MSPEQAARPKLVGAYSDVWSIGVVLYEALCGELPFDGETAHGVVVAICAAQHIPLVERSPQTHPELIALVESCLIKAREDRPINAAELKDAVRALLGRDDVRATLAGPAATPDLHLRPSAPLAEAKPFAETEEFPEADAGRDQLAVAATISAELASAEAPKSKAPALLLAVVGLLLGVAVAVLYVQSEATPEPVGNDGPALAEGPTRASASEEIAEEPQLGEEMPIAPQAETEAETIEVEEAVEPDIVLRPRMRARTRGQREPTMEPEPPATEPEPTMELVAMDSVAVMEPVVATMEAVATMEPTMEATQAVEPVRPRMRPRMRPSMTRMTGDRPGFVTF